MAMRLAKEKQNIEQKEDEGDDKEHQIKSDNAVKELASKKRLTKREKAILKMMTGRK